MKQKSFLADISIKAYEDAIHVFIKNIFKDIFLFLSPCSIINFIFGIYSMQSPYCMNIMCSGCAGLIYHIFLLLNKSRYYVKTDKKSINFLKIFNKKKD